MCLWPIRLPVINRAAAHVAASSNGRTPQQLLSFLFDYSPPPLCRPGLVCSQDALAQHRVWGGCPVLWPPRRRADA
eukprot:6207627-Pleurochrysis_carterae.AAC.2